jgi:hypothetical protein
LTVPVIDGREKFSLAKYRANKYDGVVKPGTTVSVLFSLKIGSAPEDAKEFRVSPLMTGVYLNVLGVIVISEPAGTICSTTSREPEEVVGVDVLRRMGPADSLLLNDGDEDVDFNDETF